MAVQDYERAVDLVRADRRVRRPARQPLHARLLPRRVRRRRPRLAAGGRPPRRCSRPRSRTSRAPGRAMTGGALAALAELRRRQGRPDDAAALLDARRAGAAAELVRARLALDGGDAAARGRARRAAAPRGSRPRRAWPAPRRSSCSPTRARPRRDPGAAEAALRPLRAAAASAGTAPLLARADLAAGAAGRRGRPARGGAALLEDAVDGFERGRRALRARGRPPALAAPPGRARPPRRRRARAPRRGAPRPRGAARRRRRARRRCPR